LSGNERGVSQSEYQYRHELKAKGVGGKGCFYKMLIQRELGILHRANGEEKWAMYRPYVANNLTIAAKIVKLLAKTDHNFGCRKFQFCTVQNSESEEGSCNWKRKGGIWRLLCAVSLWN